MFEKWNRQANNSKYWAMQWCLKNEIGRPITQNIGQCSDVWKMHKAGRPKAWKRLLCNPVRCERTPGVPNSIFGDNWHWLLRKSIVSKRKFRSAIDGIHLMVHFKALQILPLGDVTMIGAVRVCRSFFNIIIFVDSAKQNWPFQQAT